MKTIFFCYDSTCLCKLVSFELFDYRFIWTRRITSSISTFFVLHSLSYFLIHSFSFLSHFIRFHSPFCSLSLLFFIVYSRRDRCSQLLSNLTCVSNWIHSTKRKAKRDELHRHSSSQTITLSSSNGTSRQLQVVPFKHNVILLTQLSLKKLSRTITDCKVQ